MHHHGYTAPSQRLVEDGDVRWPEIGLGTFLKNPSTTVHEKKTRAPNTFGRPTPGVVVSRAFLADVPHAGSSSYGPQLEWL